MNKRIRHINEKHAESIRNYIRNGFTDDLVDDNDDSALFETIGSYMKGRLDLEDVNNDLTLPGTKEVVKMMISDYNKNRTGNRENEHFIRDVFSAQGSDKDLTGEIRVIKQEINEKNLNKITSEWVKEWHEKKQMIGVRDTRTEELRDYILGAINTPESEPLKTLNDESKKSKGRSLFVKYTSLAAAALIGAFLLIRTLLPSPDADKLFDAYYKPYDVVSPVTRSINNTFKDNYSAAIGSYKKGDYTMAVAGFSGILEKDPSVVSSQFYLGLSQLALENYEVAATLLASVANDSGEHGKEARWYLGLTYLKTASIQKAAACFESLAKTEGFYRDPAEKLLRRLK